MHFPGIWPHDTPVNVDERIPLTASRSDTSSRSCVTSESGQDALLRVEHGQVSRSISTDSLSIAIVRKLSNFVLGAICALELVNE